MNKTALPLAAAAVLALCAAAALASPDGLSDREEAALKQQLGEAVQKNEWSRVADLVPELAQKDDKKTWEFLVRIVERAPDGTDCASSLRVAAQTMDGRGVQDAVKKTAVKSRSIAVRRQLVLHVGARQDWPTLIELIGDADEQVASVAVWKLVDGKVEAAVDPLIALMERLDRGHEGIWDVLRNGLGRLLGMRLESGIEYRSRWEVVKQGGGLASVAPAAPEPVETNPTGGALTSGVRLFGRAIECTRIVFILDVSGSMTAIDPEAQDAPEDGTTVRGGGESQGPRQPTGKTRLERAKRELQSVLSNLPESTKINIVAYSSPHAVQMWKRDEQGRAPQIHPMTAANKRDACEFVERFQANGTTATDLALAHAFDVEGARCFYLLSDGFATHDGTTPVETAEILAVIDDKGKDRHVTVHTLGFRGADREMMMEVARHTGGKYSDIR